MSQSNSPPLTKDKANATALHVDDYILLTITFPDDRQGMTKNMSESSNSRLAYARRIGRVVDLYEDYIYEDLKKVSKYFARSLELSEPWQSAGKRFPRLHYHILIHLKDPIGLQMLISRLVYSLKLGYDIRLLKNQQEVDDKKAYILKQQANWKNFFKNYNIETYRLVRTTTQWKIPSTD